MTIDKTIGRGDAVPNFDVPTLGGQVFRYSDIWQHRNLVLVTIPAAALDDGYPGELTERSAEFDERNSACVLTRDRLPWLPAPGALVADRWGEVVYVVTGSDAAALPTPQDLLDWVEYVESRCPECEGEAR